MELVWEMFAPVVFAVLFSFFVAKLVSVVMAGDFAAERQPKSGDGVGLEQWSSVHEVQFERRLIARGCECESRVEHVEKTEHQVHQIAAETVLLLDVEAKETESEETQENLEKEVQVDHQEVLNRLLEAIDLAEKSVEEKSDRCCDEESSRGDDASFERSSSETPPDQACVLEFKEDSQCETEEAEAEISKRDVDDEDDDWEGIEKTELQKDFDVAANFVCSGETNYSLEGSDVKMQLYGLHKVATEGPCREPQPMALKVSARAKWNAWQRLGNMGPDVAMEQYITVLSENVPHWKDTARPDVGTSYNNQSTVCHEHPKLSDDSENQAANTGLDVSETIDTIPENRVDD
ncbi:hypothetical protein SAY87_021558 [Trapa incisa]|uniref:ACB domain-containing protein n=1 Tax=Trapa incisa TaxID=236973 RepID=A0AAN7JR79_9MYRT|nr:hypothetical protein SAY87_021558 [Trapa incisa]